MSEPDVVFLVELLGAAAVGGGGNGAVNLLQATTAVTIVDDDDSGVVMFELPTFEASMQVHCGVMRALGTSALPAHRVSTDRKGHLPEH
eukprot:234066-Chlamydomonas_euryale.AAC.1